MKHNYFNKKHDLKKKAREWVDKMDSLYSEETRDSINRSNIYNDDLFPSRLIETTNKMRCIVPMSSVEAITKYYDLSNKTCVLNFASFKNPGGMFINGSSAQEESLCHSSNLYNVLREFKDTYYKENLSMLNGSLYMNRCIYSPDIVFLDENDRAIRCDVLTCAAPNVNAALKYNRSSKEKATAALYDRIDYILRIAYENNVGTLILGAFGCGVFGNNPNEVSSLFKAFLDTRYKDCFENVIFAVPRMTAFDKTYDIFRNTVTG